MPARPALVDNLAASPGRVPDAEGRSGATARTPPPRPRRRRSGRGSSPSTATTTTTRSAPTARSRSWCWSRDGSSRQARVRRGGAGLAEPDARSAGSRGRHRGAEQDLEAAGDGEGRRVAGRPAVRTPPRSDSPEPPVSGTHDEAEAAGGVEGAHRGGARRSGVASAVNSIDGTNITAAAAARREHHAEQRTGRPEAEARRPGSRRRSSPHSTHAREVFCERIPNGNESAAKGSMNMAIKARSAPAAGRGGCAASAERWR